MNYDIEKAEHMVESLSDSYKTNMHIKAVKLSYSLNYLDYFVFQKRLSKSQSDLFLIVLELCLKLGLRHFFE